MRLGLICGGPSAERGISLNSARSVLDHLTPLGWEIVPFYCDSKLNFYVLSTSQLYSNTPSDFDFKLPIIAKPLSQSNLIKALRQMDIILPVIHGEFGEDGSLQEILEKHNIPFVGSSSESCSQTFDKTIAIRLLEERGFPGTLICVINESETPDLQLQKAKIFFQTLLLKKAVVQPARGGSSIGVAIVVTPENAISHAKEIFEKKLGGPVILEPYIQGREFTIIVLQNKDDEPVALIPTEIELIEGDLFTYRHKYLPTNHVRYHCPPRMPFFTDEIIYQIQEKAEKIFSLFKIRDFLRLDGWLLDDGKNVIFSDFNTISGMEQNSFLFIQGSRVGFNHGNLLHTIISHAGQRYNKKFYPTSLIKNPKAQKVRVLFGGETSERQISLLSGTNVWLKLLSHPDYLPSPYILGSDHKIWLLPYDFTLNHTVEEILAHCNESEKIITRLNNLVPPIQRRLKLKILKNDTIIRPVCMSFDHFCDEAVQENAFVFIGLHGGEGENGKMQAKFNKHRLAYNGSDVEASDLCINKYKTGSVIRNLNDPFLTSSLKILILYPSSEKPEEIWNHSIQFLGTSNILIKPNADGCSTGVMRLYSKSDLEKYLEVLSKGQSCLKSNYTRTVNDDSWIDLPKNLDDFIIEPFTERDEIYVSGHKLVHNFYKGWIELTVGLLEEDGIYHALTPSITIAEKNILSVEEKFQGGTGINLTPPPTDIITTEQIDLIKSKIEKTAKALSIQGYARIDIFFNTITNKTIIIEVNTLPGLTPSTVIYHQALAEVLPLSPNEFLSALIEKGIKRRKELNNILPFCTSTMSSLK